MAYIEQQLAPSSLDLEQKQKLVYNDSLDTSSIQNILLISSKVVESQLFFDSANSNTFPVIYSQNSGKIDLIELFRNKFQNGAKRIAFAFHDPLNHESYFLDNKPFFVEDDLIENQTTFSENVSFLTNLISEFKVENCDFLACNSLQYSNWKKYYDLLNKMTNVTCGASNDNTGNLQYGADWVMENTNENVKDIYFTNSIDNYTSSLVVFTVDNLNYSTSGSDATVTGVFFQPLNWNLIIPSTVTNGGITYNVTAIGNNALSSKQTLLSVKIPGSITNIDQFVFYNSINLSSITVDINNQHYLDINGILFNKDKTILIQYPPAKIDTLYNIPNSVININMFAFYYCNKLIRVIIPDSVKTIGDSGFQDCKSLTSVVIPDSVTTIGAYAFNNCIKMTSFTIGSGVKVVNEGVFNNCSILTSVYFNGNIPYIGGTKNFTITNDTAYYKSGVSLPLGFPPEVSISYYLSSFFTNVTIGTTPTIQPWYPTGIQSTVGDASFALVTPSSDSLGSFIYTISNSSVATINDNVISVDSSGSCIITALQDACGNYFSNSTTSTLTVNENPLSNICFRKGTPIRTDQGLIHIDKINPASHTIRNKKIVAITKTVTQDKYLVCFEKDSLGPSMPSQKTVISSNHKIFNKGTMIKAKEFVGKYENIYKVKYTGEVLYNVLMEEYDKIVVNNLICESLHPENTIAQLYTILQDLNLEQQKEVIKQFNEFTIKNNIYTSSSSKK